MICKRCIVSGRVQGVWYRASTQRKADELHVTGYARNLPGGRVEVLACGDVAAVAQLVAWLWVGSTASKVTAVEEQSIETALPDLPRAFVTG